MTIQEQRLLRLFNQGHTVRASRFIVHDNISKRWSVEYPGAIAAGGPTVISWLFDRGTNKLISKNWENVS